MTRLRSTIYDYAELIRKNSEAKLSFGDIKFGASPTIRLNIDEKKKYRNLYQTFDKRASLITSSVSSSKEYQFKANTLNISYALDAKFAALAKKELYKIVSDSYDSIINRAMKVDPKILSLILDGKIKESESLRTKPESFLSGRLHILGESIRGIINDNTTVVLTMVGQSAISVSTKYLLVNSSIVSPSFRSLNLGSFEALMLNMPKIEEEALEGIKVIVDREAAVLKDSLKMSLLSVKPESKRTRIKVPIRVTSLLKALENEREP